MSSDPGVFAPSPLAPPSFPDVVPLVTLLSPSLVVPSVVVVVVSSAAVVGVPSAAAVVVPSAVVVVVPSAVVVVVDASVVAGGFPL